jgi:drug/metabolite transporter (DMT)-like permease
VNLSDLLSFLCAALAALGNALANVMQRKSGLEQGKDRPFGLRLLWDLVRSPTWLMGFLGLVGSFVLQAVALGLGQLSAVEPIITIEVPLTLLIASRVFGTRLRRTEWSGILVMTAGMIALVALLEPRPGDETHVSHVIYGAAGGATTATIVGLVLISRRGGAVWKTSFLGAAAGTSFGLTATFLKETIAQGDHRGVLGVVTTWQTYTAIGFGIGGLVLMQWALHEGPLLAAQPGFTLMDPLVSILWGVLVFNEMTRTGWWLVPAAAGAVSVGVGVVILAHSPLLTSMTDESLPDSAEVIRSG